MGERIPVSGKQMEELCSLCKSDFLSKHIRVLIEFQDEYDELKDLINKNPSALPAVADFKRNKVERLAISFEEFKNDIDTGGYKYAIMRLFQEPLTDKSLEHLLKKLHQGRFMLEELHEFRVKEPVAVLGQFIGQV